MDIDSLRQHLVDLLHSRNAHADFEAAVRALPAQVRGVRPEGQSQTPWQLLEHLRICQWDILEFSRDPDHVSPSFPAGYWPAADAPADDSAWDHSIEAFRRDLRAMSDLVADPQTDLFAKIPWGDGQTILREALLVADHNAYHVGQLVTLRHLLGTWPPAV